jgi:putative FmdB family regulatory protein
MPIWKFICQDCHATSDLMFTSLDATKTATCPECGSTKVERQPAAPNFTVKGYNAANGYAK